MVLHRLCWLFAAFACFASATDPCDAYPSNCQVLPLDIDGRNLTWGSTFSLQCASAFPSPLPSPLRLNLTVGDNTFPCTFPRLNTSVVTNTLLHCTAVLMNDAMFDVPLSLVLSSDDCAGIPVASAVFSPPVAHPPDYTLPPFDIEEGGVVSVRLPRRPLSPQDWTDAGLVPPQDAGTVEMFLGDTQLYVPPQDNIIEIVVPPGDGKNLRLTVEIAGLFNVTSDGLDPDAPIPANANASQYVSYKPPALSSVVPSIIQWPDMWDSVYGAQPGLLTRREINATRSFYLIGRDLGADRTRLAEVEIGGVPCTPRFINDTVALCTGWNATEAAVRHNAKNTVDVVRLVVRFLWYGTWFDYDDMMEAWPRPQVIVVAPERVQPDTTMLVYGKFFGPDTSCTTCDQLGMQILFGVPGKYTPCPSLQMLSDTAMTCKVPTVDGATPGYPQVTVFVRNAVGVVSEINAANHTVSFPEHIGVRRAAESPAFLDAIPSGSAENQLYALEPALTVEVFGNGTATCWVDVQSVTRLQTSQIVGVGLGTNDAAPSVVGNVSTALVLTGAAAPTGNDTTSSESAATRWTFKPVGVKTTSSALIFLVFRCQDARGEISVSEEKTLVNIAGMSAAWDEGSTAFFASPQPPLQLSSIQAFYSWTNVSVNTTQGLTMMPECQAILIPNTTAAEIQRAIGDFERLALSTATPVISRMDDTGAMLRIVFSGLSLAQAALGAELQLLSECQWGATGERVRLPVKSVSVADLSVTWVVNGSVVTEGRVFELLPLTPIDTSFRVTSSALASAVAPGAMSCRLTSVTSSTLRLAQGSSTESYSVLADGTGARLVNLEVEGAPGLTVSVAVECTVWQRIVRSQTLTILSAGLSLRVNGAPPTQFLPSDGAMQFPLRPPFSVEILDPQGSPLPSITCSIASTSRGVTVRLNKDSTTMTSGSNSSLVVISDANIQTTFAGEKNPKLVLTCRRQQRDGPESFSFNIAMTTMEAKLCQAPETVVQSQTALSRWTVGVSVNGDDPCTGTSLNSLSHLVDTFPPIICSIESNSSFNGNRTLFTENGVATLDAATRIAEFTRFKITGNQDTVYAFSVECSMGSIPIPNIIQFQVQILGCPVGSQANGVFCVTCPEREYSFGGVNGRCVGCPPVGAVCTSGILKLLPSFYRAPEDNNRQIGPDTQLFPCYNAEACVVNGTSNTYECAVGYQGALCGVCSPGYGIFNGVCRKCWDKGSTDSLVGFVIVAFLALLIFLAQRRPSGKTAPAIIFLRVMVGFLQALSALQVFKEGGTRAFRDIMGWTAFVSESPLATGALQCGFNWSFVGQYIVTIILPWMVVGGTIVMFGIISAFQLIWQRAPGFVQAWTTSLRTFWTDGRPASTLMMALFVGYMPTVSASLKVLDCYEKPVGNRYWLRSNLEIECGVGEHAITRLLAIAVLVGYGVGFPFAIFFFLRRADKAKLEDPRFKSAYGFVYDGYRVGKSAGKEHVRSCKQMIGGGHMVWWESVILLRKFAIVLLAVLVSDPFYQVVGATLLLSAFFMLQQRFQPYDGKLFNLVESLVLGDLFVTVSVSLLLLQALVDKTNPDQRASISDILVTIFLVLINMAVLGILLVIWFRSGCQQLMSHRRVQGLTEKCGPLCKRRNQSMTSVKQIDAGDGFDKGMSIENPMRQTTPKSVEGDSI